jgi:predicted Zn-dependent peptidase
LIEAKLAEMEGLRLEVQKIYVPNAFSSQLGKNGAVGVNAFTSKDQTQYTASVPSDMLEQWFSIVSEQLFEPSWREFYVEKEVVQREWAYRYVNNPAGAAQLDLDATAYTAHPYRNPVIGWKADMESFNTRDAMAFHAKYYHPSNAVCVLVGDVKVDDAKKLAEIYFARYPEGKRAPEKVTQEPLQKGPRKSVRFLKGARTPMVRIGFHAAPMGTKDFYALDAMTMVLSHGRGARLTQAIVNKGLAVSAWAHNPDNRYGGMVVLGGSPNDPQGLTEEDQIKEGQRLACLGACEDLEDTLLKQVHKLKTELVSARELQRIKKLNERDFLDRMRSNEALAGILATLEVQVGWRYLTTYLSRMAEVAPEDIKRVANRYLRHENKTSVYVIPGGEPDHAPEPYAEIRSVTGAAASRMARPEILVNHSVYRTPEGWKHPLSFERRPEKIEYPEAKRATVKGATVFYLPDRELPLIDLTLLVKAGGVDLPSNKTGLTEVMNRCLIRGGTENYEPAALALALDENAIRLALSVGQEEAAIHLSVMKKDWTQGLSLLEEVLLRPRFDPGVLQVAKAEEHTDLKRQGGDAQAVSKREAMIWHFNGHPYGRDPLQGLETIPSITKADLKAFATEYFVPSNMVVAISGDIEMDEGLKGLKSLFRGFLESSAPERKLDEPPETPPILTLIHKPGQVQSQVILCLPSVERTDSDFWKMSLLTDILGGRDSFMSTRLRDDLGLVYAAWFYQAFKWKAGMLIGYLGSKGDNTARAIEETVSIMTALQEEVPEEELEQKRLDALNSFVFNVDTPAALVEAYGRYHMRGEPLDTLGRIQDAFLEATGEELRALSRRFLDPDLLQVFVVGDKTTRVNKKGGSPITLEKDLTRLAEKLSLPFREIPLR